MNQSERLLEEIDMMREKLVNYGLNYGLGHEKTLEYSQYLDALLNEYMMN
ncbi:aspartyl-phosphate phosphatase Spo0E family protein [Desertibacillus haloalkaliphilus]|nr:aspartyl-phosphate phosphatase Spo0E family protein [Desertibacillus haloalkaliphilus]MBU8908144.1 aspartyl-phosphate phosphatase Spo0E family protein [Desertibacillus haloalkaliphilus]